MIVTSPAGLDSIFAPISLANSASLCAGVAADGAPGRFVSGEVAMQAGGTWYAATGNLWWVAAMVLLLAGSWAPSAANRRRLRREQELV